MDHRGGGGCRLGTRPRDHLSEVITGFLFAFLAGGVTLNVLKEELPEERQSRFWPFLLGAAGYAALLLVGSVQA